MQNQNLSAAEALEKLKTGNERYLEAEANPGDISPKIRQYTCENGQSPYAIVVTCSDSRVIPEGIFSAGIGELFVIRVAGNVMDRHQIGSVEYAADHLGTKLVVVLGHSNCGAVGAALHHDPSGYVKYITDEIRKAIGDEKDEAKACCECTKKRFCDQRKPWRNGREGRPYRLRSRLRYCQRKGSFFGLRIRAPLWGAPLRESGLPDSLFIKRISSEVKFQTIDWYVRFSAQGV